MNDRIIAAIIGATFGLGVLLVRDIILRFYFDKRADRKTAREVFLSYADPLSAAAASLLWRLDEIMNSPGRGAYLRRDIAQTKFVEYKKLSTIYRLAKLLGWIRAFSRELSFLRAEDHNSISEIKSALRNLEKALADGTHIESKRLSSLLDLWKHIFTEPIDDAVKRSRIEFCLERQLKEFLHESNVELATELDDEKKMLLCRKLANTISEELGMSHEPSSDILRETKSRAIECISLREAWLYRDWQAGVGDLMITTAPTGKRHYDIIGYRDFELVYKNGEQIDKDWIARVEAIVRGLDTSLPNNYDVRIEQLRNTMTAVAALFISLVEGEREKKALFTETLELARRLSIPQ